MISLYNISLFSA